MLAFLLIVNTLSAVVKGVQEILKLIQKEILEDSAKVFRNAIKTLGEPDYIDAEIVKYSNGYDS